MPDPIIWLADRVFASYKSSGLPENVLTAVKEGRKAQRAYDSVWRNRPNEFKGLPWSEVETRFAEHPYVERIITQNNEVHRIIQPAVSFAHTNNLTFGRGERGGLYFFSDFGGGPLSSKELTVRLASLNPPNGASTVAGAATARESIRDRFRKWNAEHNPFSKERRVARNAAKTVSAPGAPPSVVPPPGEISDLGRNVAPKLRFTEKVSASFSEAKGRKGLMFGKVIGTALGITALGDGLRRLFASRKVDPATGESKGPATTDRVVGGVEAAGGLAAGILSLTHGHKAGGTIGRS